MAGKKPAKPMAGQRKQPLLDPSVWGTSVKYMGSKSAPCTCTKCGRSLVRGMVRVLNDEFYCSLTCIKPVEESVV